MVVSWLHRKTKETTPKYSRVMRQPVATTLKWFEKRILCTVFATFLSICDCGERERNEWCSKAPCTASRYCSLFWSQKDNWTWLQLMWGTEWGLGQPGSFATGCRLWALLGSCSGTSGWGLNKAAISQPCQGALNLVCLWGLERSLLFTMWCPEELPEPPSSPPP